MAEIKVLSWDSSLVKSKVSPKEHICKNIKEQLMNWSTGRKSVTLWCVCCPAPGGKQAGSAHALYNVCAARPVLPRAVILTAQGQSSSHLTERVLDKPLSFLKDTLRKINSFTQSKMLNRENFLFLFKSWSNNAASHLASCGMNL